jgi:hypothetical protein
MTRLNWKEKLPAYFFILIGVIYLALWFFSVFLHERSLATASDPDKIVIGRAELISNLRTILTFSSCIVGGIQFLRLKKIGWILLVIMMVIFMIISAGAVYQAINTGAYIVAVVAGAGILVFLFWIINFLLPSLRARLGIARNELIKLSVVFAIYSVIYFLQEL